MKYIIAYFKAWEFIFIIFLPLIVPVSFFLGVFSFVNLYLLWLVSFIAVGGAIGSKT